MKYRFDIVQNTPEWDLIKLGIFSASVTTQLLSGHDTKGYIQLIDKIAEERFTGEKCLNKPWKGNEYTDRGHEFEPSGAQEFKINNFVELKSVGFVQKDEWCGCSPDRLVDDNKLLQIKCPIFSTQVKYLQDKKVDPVYLKQMQFELFCCEDRESDYFYSYHPKLPPLQIEVFRDPVIQEQIKSALEIAKQKVLEKIEMFKKLGV